MTLHSGHWDYTGLRRGISLSEPFNRNGPQWVRTVVRGGHSEHRSKMSRSVPTPESPLFTTLVARVIVLVFVGERHRPPSPRLSEGEVAQPGLLRRLASANDSVDHPSVPVVGCPLRAPRHRETSASLRVILALPRPRQVEVEPVVSTVVPFLDPLKGPPV